MYGLYSVSWRSNRNNSLYDYSRSRVRIRHSYVFYNCVQYRITIQNGDCDGDGQFDGDSDKDGNQYRIGISVADSHVFANGKCDANGDSNGDSIGDPIGDPISNKDSDAKWHKNRKRHGDSDFHPDAHSVQYGESIGNYHRIRIQYREFIRNNYGIRVEYGDEYGDEYCYGHSIKHAN